MMNAIRFGAITMSDVKPGVTLTNVASWTQFTPDEIVRTGKTWLFGVPFVVAKGDTTWNTSSGVEGSYGNRTLKFPDTDAAGNPVNHDWFVKTPRYYLSSGD